MFRSIAAATIFALTLVIGTGTAFPYAKTGEDCTKCHALNVDQARTILDGLIPGVKVLMVQQAPIAGLWELGIDTSGSKMIVYLDYSKKHIISPATRGELVSLKTRASLTQESLQLINKVDVSKIPLKDALVMGDKTAKHRIIVFDDPD